VSDSLFCRWAMAIVAALLLLAITSPGVLASGDIRVVPVREASTYWRDGAVLRALGVLQEVPETGEEEPMSRLAFAKKAVRLFGGRRQERFHSGSAPEFADAGELEKTDWGAVNAAAGMGLVRACGEAGFRPGDAVTVAEALVVLLRGRGVDWEVHAPYPAGVLMAADEEGLLEELPGLGMHDPLLRGDAHRLFAQVAPEDRDGQFAVGLVTGVCSVSGEIEAFSTEGEETWSLADEVHLLDADELEAAVGHAVLIVFDEGGNAGFVEMNEPVHTYRGELCDYALDPGSLCIDGEWVDLDLDRENAVMWECNGMLTGIVPGHEEMFEEQLQRWCEMGADTAVHRNEDGWGSVIVDYWDVPVAAVQTVPEEDPGGDLVVLLETEPVELPLRLSVTEDRPEVFGDAQSLCEVQEGDLVRVATVGGGGWQLHRMEVSRDRITGALVPDEYRRRRSPSETLHYFTWESGEELVIDEDAFLGNPAGLRRANWLTVALDAGGEAVYAVAAKRAGVDVPVLVTDCWEDAGGLYVRGDYRGTRADLPVEMDIETLDAEISLEGHPASALVQFVEDPGGDVVGIAARAVALPGPTGTVTVVSLNADEKCVTLRLEDLQYAVSVDPLVYDSEGEYVKLHELSAGDEVMRYEINGWEVLILERNE